MRYRLDLAENLYCLEADFPEEVPLAALSDRGLLALHEGLCGDGVPIVEVRVRAQPEGSWAVWHGLSRDFSRAPWRGCAEVVEMLALSAFEWGLLAPEALDLLRVPGTATEAAILRDRIRRRGSGGPGPEAER